MSNYKKKCGARVTAALWDWIRAKHRAGWDTAYIVEDTGFSRNTIRRVIHGQIKRPDELAPRDDEDRGAYMPSPSELRREVCKLRAAHLAEKKSQPWLGGHGAVSGIREVSFHGHRRASTIGGTT